MKKILFVVVTLLIALTFGLNSVAYAEQGSEENYKDSFAYKFIAEFTEQFPNRKAGINVNDPFADIDGKLSLQGYLKSQIISSSNGMIKDGDIKHQSFLISEYVRGYNIVATLRKQGSDKQIIIGAHYDSDGQGANDNASGVAALLLTIQELSQNADNLPCNVIFVLFDGEELGMYGSYNYVGQMSQTEKDNTLLMINMDSIANGDNLYVWCENKHTDLAGLITSKSDKVNEKPYAAGTYNLDSGLGYGYIETPQNSDHTPFRMAGIPTALFFSGTYAADPWHYSESVNPFKNTMNTSADTLENLDKYSGAEFVSKINATADTISKTVLDNEFLTVAVNQRNQIINYNVLGRTLWARIICFGILVIGIVLAFTVYYRKLQKKAILGTAEIKNTKVFSTPNAEDVFSFGDKNVNSNKPPVEDIFTMNDKKK